MNRPTAPNAATTPAPAPGVSPLYQQLDALLAELVAHQTAMVQLAEQHRRAIAAADLKALAECNARQQTAAQNQMRLDSRRAALVTAISGRPAAPLTARNQPTHAAQPPVTLRQLASAAPEPLRPRLLQSVDRLKSLAQTATVQQQALRVAAENLLLHAGGLLSQVRAAVNPKATYSRPGDPAAAAPLFAVDVTS